MKGEQTHPKDADGVPRAERRTIRLDHTEHAMKLPANEEDDKQVMRIPEVFKVGTLPLLDGEEDHDT